MVSGPEPPEADLTLVATDVTGVETAVDGRADVPEEVGASEDEEDAAVEVVREVGELPLELAKPVTVEIVGFEDAWLEPIVAYATPF